ncbi:TetR/AcrR family transcriptional regulator [Cucumibacter marinus]|uniref:TetR/AcrR family transcriptional regulator n=1 Tax=Cucumibacter marinus TaxID=1121252 RepID=UPI0004189611|nr:TetR/AcrR family transcriptional regulator [Cucumibacter marinus]
MSDIAAPVGPKRLSSKDRRKEIAEAARALITEHGFEGLKTRAIAERVGINIATLHYHVSTKAELLTLVAQSLREEFVAQRLARPRDLADPVDALRAEFEDYREKYAERPQTMALLDRMHAKAMRDPAVDAIMAPLVENWYGAVREVLEKGVETGAFRADLDIEAAARMIVGALLGFRRLPGANPDMLDRVEAEIWRSIRPVSAD